MIIELNILCKNNLNLYQVVSEFKFNGWKVFAMSRVWIEKKERLWDYFHNVFMHELIKKLRERQNKNINSKFTSLTTVETNVTKYRYLLNFMHKKINIIN